MQVIKFRIFLSYLVAACCAIPAMAQSVPLKDDQKAVVLFDFRMERFVNSDIAKALGLADQLAATAGGDMDLSQATRIFGITSLPQSVQEFEEMQMGTSPDIDFSVRIMFASEAAATANMKKISEESEDNFSRDGRTFYRMPGGDELSQRASASQLNETTLEVGTDRFVFLDSQRDAFTTGLQDAWSKISSIDDTLRIAIDLAGAKNLVGEALEMGRAQADPVTQGFLELVPNLNSISMTMDMSGGDLLGLSFACKDSESAQELKEALDGIFAIAKMTGGPMIQQMSQDDPKMGEVGQQLLRSLTPRQEQNEVMVKIPKPNGLEEVILNAMQGFGLGGGGFGPDF